MKANGVSRMKMNKEYYEKLYPSGTILELTESMDDPYSPKPAGSKFKVSFIDDSLNIHGSWLAPARGSISIIIGVDKFKIAG